MPLTNIDKVTVNICKQPAQERLKRLQTQLKKSHEREKGNATQKGTTQSRRNGSSFREAKRTIPTKATAKANESTWARPKALYEAGHKLSKADGKPFSVNERLNSLRSLLKEQQQKLTQNNNNSSKVNLMEDESMDWQEIDPQDPVEPMSLDIVIAKFIDGHDLPARRLDHYYFVLDTNVLIDHPVFVEELTKVALGSSKGSMLFIPYIVIKELDKLKDKQRNDNPSLRQSAIRAIKYLNRKFDESLSIQAQSAVDEADHLIEVDCPDDSIVNCCLQLKKEVESLMLLTNDNNLRLKAHASDIKVSCRSDLLAEYPDAFDSLDKK